MVVIMVRFPDLKEKKVTENKQEGMHLRKFRKIRKIRRGNNIGKNRNLAPCLTSF